MINSDLNNEKKSDKKKCSASNEVSSLSLPDKKEKQFFRKCNLCGRKGHRNVDCYYYRESCNDQHVSFEKSKCNHEKCDIGCASCIARRKNNCGIFELSRITCYLDSTASNHYVNSEAFLIDAIELSEPFSIKVADRKILTTSKVGKLFGTNKMTGSGCNFSNVYYVPRVPYNVLSVHAITHEGFLVTFKEKTVQIFKNNELFAIGVLEDNLYRLDFFVENNTDSYESDLSLAIWHLRLGHISKSGLNKLMKSGYIKANESALKNFFCNMCFNGKLSELPWKNNCTLATRPLELVHSDIFGPVIPASKTGMKYFISFLDDFTRFTVTFFMKNKSQAFLKFRDYVIISRAYQNLKISKLKVDIEAEYNSKRFQTFCNKNGIEIEYTEQAEFNGQAWKLNRLIMERAKIMLIDSGLGKEMWAEAVENAVYVLNRSFTVRNELPASMWYNKSIGLSNLRIFGSKAYIKDMNGLRGPEMCQGYMIGYAGPCYRILETNGEVELPRYVMFDEKEILFNSKKHKYYLHLRSQENKVLYKVQAKLFKLNTLWKEEGIGEVKLCLNKQNKKFRVLMRNDKTSELCADHYIISDFVLRQKVVKHYFDHAWVCLAEANAADGHPSLEILALQFMNANAEKKWREKIKRAKLLYHRTKAVADLKEINAAEKKVNAISNSFLSCDNGDENFDVIDKVQNLSIKDSDKDYDVIDRVQSLSIEDADKDVIGKVQCLSINDAHQDAKKRRFN